MNTLELFQIPFCRLTKQQAVDVLIQYIKDNQGAAVCFPDMSTINIALTFPEIHQLIQKRFISFNDGAGIALAAYLRGQPFPNNLNGTDLVPLFLKKLPKETKVYLVGGNKGVAARTKSKFSRIYPSLDFVGAHQGYFCDEAQLVNDLKTTRPDVVLVGMGNPLQLQWIEKQRLEPMFSSVLWLAVGGLFDFYGGDRVRAPLWMRRLSLEWLHILWIQPQKLKRYVFGIPLFFMRVLFFSIGNKHHMSK